MSYNLHFTFGPVQAFVAQARRTRDLYAGSLLLSHLAMAAMRALTGGKIILPDFAKLSEIEATSEHATAPNRFVAEFETEAAAAKAGCAAEEALRQAWRDIADAVWRRYLQKHGANGNGTAEIWRRQVEYFWNIAWVVGEKCQTDLLDRRKNWQTHFPPAEGGDHCTLMGQWQELSGFIRSHQRKPQDEFWQTVRDDSEIRQLDLEEGERLCAIAFIKRFFPSVAKQAIGRKLDPKGWPSTVTIAALPWMRKVVSKPEWLQQAKLHAGLVASEPGALVASAHRIKLLRDVAASTGSFANLSGNFLNRTALSNAGDTPLRDGTHRERLLDSLRKLEGATDDRAGNFYAVLLMDGDSMGALIQEHGAGSVTSALTDFASTVPEVVSQHDGVTVYAGGDDLLALLPLDRALEAACAVHTLYGNSFGSEARATVSAAIVFAHYRCTFSRVLASAHELLDDVAKDHTGRDALAIRVLKPGGTMCEWSAPFNHFMKTTPQVFDPLVKEFRDEKKPDILSASLLYNLRERFSHLTQDETAHVQREELHALFTAEALIGKLDSEQTEGQRERIGNIMNHLLDVCEIMRRNPETKQCEATGAFTFHGPRLVKFLALDGKEGAE